MKPIPFIHQNTVFAEDQPQYLSLPAYRTEEGAVTTCWQLTWWDRLWLLFTGRLWLCQMTFNDPLQPQCLTLTSPFRRHS